MTAGFVLLGVGYMTSALVGAIMVDVSKPIRELDEHYPLGTRANDSYEYGRRLLIPLVGPYMATRYVDTAAGQLFTVLWGSMQTVGMVLGAVGIGMYVAAKKRAPGVAARLQLLPNGVLGRF